MGDNLYCSSLRYSICESAYDKLQLFSFSPSQPIVHILLFHSRISGISLLALIYDVGQEVDVVVVVIVVTVEFLLDLNQARLDSQGLDFIFSLSSRDSGDDFADRETNQG